MTQAIALQFLLFSYIVSLCQGSKITGCTFEKHKTTSSVNGEAEIEPLKGKSFQVLDGDFTYHIGICVSATNLEKLDGAGVVQIDRKNANQNHVIGRINHADIVAGPGWVMLEYNQGDRYTSHCPNDTNRRAQIMFTCDMDVTEEQPVILEEQNNKTDSCYYLFEFATSKVCRKRPSVKKGLSVGSIMLIVFVSVLFVYLIAGFLYNRFVLRAKGLEQMPNLGFWKDFGNLQADGCNLICRSKKTHSSRSFQGIGDDQLVDGNHLNTDDSILPM